MRKINTLFIPLRKYDCLQRTNKQIRQIYELRNIDEPAMQKCTEDSTMLSTAKWRYLSYVAGETVSIKTPKSTKQENTAICYRVGLWDLTRTRIATRETEKRGFRAAEEFVRRGCENRVKLPWSKSAAVTAAKKRK
jgi:hypothetical protein